MRDNDTSFGNIWYFILFYLLLFLDMNVRILYIVNPYLDWHEVRFILISKLRREQKASKNIGFNSFKNLSVDNYKAICKKEHCVSN